MAGAEEPCSPEEARRTRVGGAPWRRRWHRSRRTRRGSLWIHIGRKPIGLKWVYKVKKNERGDVVKHKARLVAKGFVRREGIDFEEVFAPVARMDSVSLLAPATTRDRSVHHPDVKSAFLNGELTEVVHVRQPHGFIVAGEEGKVLRLGKALFMEDPRKDHMAAVKHLLRYIAGTCALGLAYPRRKKTSDLHLFGFSDSDMGGDIDGRKSTSGMVFFLETCPISWQSQKQKIVALSTCEAEYISGAAAACHGIWLRRLLEDITGQAVAAPILRIDNKSAIELAKNPVFHSRSKHIDIKFHFIRDCVERKQVVLEQVGTEQQLADVFTKPLGKNNFEKLKSQVGMVEIKQEHSH
ncbi:hypothetical protein U9M48_017023 [Paspalum notatum var. saurae]|uniref:Reverse transcriptase Ty1/copia-type domain-containing protein n=1 Tax=Paspalum notatum var. saurae TaxID=547442 RepID=A0AAQ3T8W0_PASNO